MPSFAFGGYSVAIESRFSVVSFDICYAHLKVSRSLSSTWADIGKVLNLHQRCIL